MMFCTEWFQIQREFATPYEEMSQMSSEILTVSRFYNKNIPYRDPSRVGSSLEKSFIFQAIFYYWRQSI